MNKKFCHFSSCYICNKWLKFIKWVDEFNKQCDLLDIIPGLSFNDLLEYYRLGYNPGILASFVLSCY
jgi:hypothetical protein